MNARNFEVKRNRLSETRVVTAAPASPDKDEVLLKVDRFALTANNITYGVVGDKLGYWKFFPVANGWGIIPVWGFADVIETRHPDIEIGERLYGYFPMATHLVMRPGKLSGSRIIDTSAHRADLPIVDISGNGAVLSELHERLGENMKVTLNVGVTHYEQNEMGSHFIHERSGMFFAPSHIQKRTQDWGPGEFEKKAYRFWHGASIRSRAWLVIEQYEGMDALVDIYSKLLAGKAPPDKGIIVSL